ncbi:AMMECR1-like protein [Candida viswanathii]|uniref:AMMECR1-like protein n=1 Tax=Candida viswanathii TaxID=5486 RepID=A0A367XRL0_9ASCO|nr:AMMECR1-like protein [Candida viswanathii]
MSKALCCYAFESLSNKLNVDPNHGKIPLSRFYQVLKENPSSLPSLAPLFITWNKNHHLRGCIGTFSKLAIDSGVSRFSLTSALQDPRFPPINAKELEDLEVSVTLLDNFVGIDDPTQWEIGLNGLKVSFDVDGGHYSGTFLPSVAEDEEWDKLTTLYYLLKKADYSVAKSNTIAFYEKGISEGWLKLTKYDGLKSKLDYLEYVSIRDQV